MAETGFVTLVGAGPGDPGLITVAALEALHNADVVLYDRLVGEEVLRALPEQAERIDVGKQQGTHPVPQQQINQLILDHALAGKKVVRLKGGDPYLFGRGAEELAAVAEHGIPFQVIPGITSAIAAPAYAGIPVTHREYASSLHIVTAQGKHGEKPNIPFAELAKLNGTLVFLMGVAVLENICVGLIAAGMTGSTPAAVVENGSTPKQRRLIATLAELPAKARDMNLQPPAVLIVGTVCELADSLDWFGALPLHGKRVLTVSSSATASRLAAKLRRFGAQVDEMAAIHQQPLPLPEAFWPTVGSYEWIALTSRFAARLFFSGLIQHAIDFRTLCGARFAAVGPGTAEEIAANGIQADYIPERFTAEALGQGLTSLKDAAAENSPTPARRGVLLFRAKEANREIDAALEAAGIPFEAVDAYTTQSCGEGLSDVELFGQGLRNGAYDCVTFTSASAVRAFTTALGDGFAPSAPAYCIGEITAEAAARHGWTTRISDNASLDSLAELIIKDCAKPI
ncbi:MAG: uroporphyrinogen-III C-methyltransferase [Planctomycetes bacterium]|nr:uroporphyrinogen-III C-methyltransferase [Planctomycetota bacterium]